MSKEIKIDLSKVKTKYYIDWATQPENFNCLLSVLDKAIEGGVSDRPMTDLPAILAKFMAEMNEFKTEIDLAIGSMKSYLSGSGE